MRLRPMSFALTSYAVVFELTIGRNAIKNITLKGKFLIDLVFTKEAARTYFHCNKGRTFVTKL